jgi:hypothetical protein
MKRFFAFGCSYTKYSFATWADFVGANFDEYYNYGRHGCSNTYIMNRLIEADDKFKFNSNDVVIVMLTGLCRFSYLPTNTDWATQGDLMNYLYHNKNSNLEWFVKNMWSESYSVYSGWTSTKIIKELLTAKNIKHMIFMGIDNSAYLTDKELSIDAKQKVQEIYNMTDLPVSLDEWRENNYKKDEWVYWAESKSFDGHPSQKMHYDFVKKYMPEYATDKSDDIFNKVESIFINSNQQLQGKNFSKMFHDSYDLSNTNPLFRN